MFSCCKVIPLKIKTFIFLDDLDQNVMPSCLTSLVITNSRWTFRVMFGSAPALHRLGKINGKLSIHRSRLRPSFLLKQQLQLLLLWLASLLFEETTRMWSIYHFPPSVPVAPSIPLARTILCIHHLVARLMSTLLRPPLRLRLSKLRNCTFLFRLHDFRLLEFQNPLAKTRLTS